MIACFFVAVFSVWVAITLAAFSKSETTTAYDGDVVEGSGAPVAAWAAIGAGVVMSGWVIAVVIAMLAV